MIAVNTDHSLKMSYPLHALQCKQPLILENLNNKNVVVDTVIIEKIGKSGTNQILSGEIYFSSTLC